MSDQQSILVIRFSSLGDVVLTTPFVRSLKRTMPHATITFATKETYAPLLRGNPAIDNLVLLREGETLSAFARRLETQGRFSYVFDLHDNLRTAGLRRLLKGRWMTYRKGRIKRTLLVHFGIDLYGDAESVRRRYLRAASAVNVPFDDGPPEVFPTEEARQTLPAFIERNTILLAPGARHRTKRWPAHHWKGLARRLVASGRQVVALGDTDEETLLGDLEIPGMFGAPLESAIAAVERAALVVANDSGLMHLATAVNTGVIAMFGPTVRQFGFFPRGKDARVVELDLPCRPCSASGSAHCPLGHHACLDSIDPDHIVSLIEAA